MLLCSRCVIRDQNVKSSVVWKENYFEPHLVMTNNLSSYQREWLASLSKEGKNISVINICI